VVSGDFGQLQPPGRGKPLYSHTVSGCSNSRCLYKEQIESMGKAVWHSFTTVVLLTENLRQKGLSLEDKVFCVALENMRFACCTESDIELLRTCVATSNTGQLLDDPNFRNVSIITAHNQDRDTVNDAGCVLFAQDNDLQLSHFYSCDCWATNEGNVNGSSLKGAWKKKRKVFDPTCKTDRLSAGDQEHFWSLSPEHTDHSPGKLSICLGMLILLKKNVATEMCITNRAEGVVAGWRAVSLGDGCEALDALFVESINPPKSMHLDTLPENVAPVTLIS
jgi:hypothetical protein